MLIQPLLFPDKKNSIEPAFYFQGSPDGHVDAGKTASLETYFNAFSIGRWCEYTVLDNLYLKLKIEGDVEIKAFNSIGSVDEEYLQKGREKLLESEYIKQVNEKAYKAIRTEIPIEILKTDNDYSIKFVQLPKDGILYVTIKAVSDVKILGGGYYTQVEESQLNPVKMAIGICTFKREEFVRRNVKCICEDLISNQNSPLFNKLEVYVADNGQTLDRMTFEDENVHLFPNPNLGGAGGFTRTMIESMFYDRAKEFTHIIFMDDDILLYPPVLERSYYLLRMIKAQYRKAILGAGMLLLDKPYLQQEVGALYKDTTTYIGKANHKFFDLRRSDAISANEASGPTNYTGWWYACIPATVATEQNMPLPFFIHYDDAEYGMRNADNGQLFLNGICVWHPAPQNKGPFWIYYYNVRNRLITMFSKRLDKCSFRKYIKAITKMFMTSILRFEYAKAGLYLQGLNDFLKGPDNFIQCDALSLHRELQKNRIEYLSPDSAGIDESSIVKGVDRNFLIAGLIQLFYTIMPTKEKLCAVDANHNYTSHNAQKYYLYFDNLKTGFVVAKNRRKFFALLFKYCSAVLKLNFRFNSMHRDWQKAKSELTSLPFWEKYLGLK